jgi:Fe-S-cluster containining protein
MKRGSFEEPEVLRDKRKLAADESFSFSCHSRLPCFNCCCADVNIILTPIDVLRLARKVGLTTTEFLEKHALVPITQDLELPVVMLRMGEEPEKKCTFVGPEGCTVYEDRPWACRMYPVGMALPPARAGVEPEPIYFLFEDDFCKGHGEQQSWTVKQWRKDQRVLEHEDLETGLKELVSHPWFIGGRKLDPRRMEMFFTACYDLDKFRSFIFDSTFLQRFVVEPDLVQQLETDDLALLRFGFRWLRYALFAEPTMTQRDDAPSSPRKT